MNKKRILMISLCALMLTGCSGHNTSVSNGDSTLMTVGDTSYTKNDVSSANIYIFSLCPNEFKLGLVTFLEVKTISSFLLIRMSAKKTSILIKRKLDSDIIIVEKCSRRGQKSPAMEAVKAISIGNESANKAK